MKISEKTKYVRYKLKLTQSQLAKATGISEVTIIRWENGNSIKPQIKSYGKFIDFCSRNGIDTSDLEREYFV